MSLPTPRRPCGRPRSMAALPGGYQGWRLPGFLPAAYQEKPASRREDSALNRWSRVSGVAVPGTGTSRERQHSRST